MTGTTRRRRRESAPRAGGGVNPRSGQPRAGPSGGAGLGRRRLGAGLAGLAALAWLCLAGLARATTTPGVDAPPPAGPAAAIQVPPVHELRLPNGLTLAVVPRPGLPLVTLALLLRTGPEADPADRPGVAAMMATLLTKGSRRQGRAVAATQMAQQAEALGGQLDSASAWQATTLAMTVTTPHAGAALALLADSLLHPLLAADELERARTQAIDALRVSLGSPAEVAALAARRAYWGDTPYGAVVTPQALGRITRAELQAFHARWSRPDNALLVLAGDIDARQAQALARRVLGAWRKPRQGLPSLPPSPPASRREQLVLVDMPGSGQSAIVLAAPYAASAAAEHSNWRIAQVANAVLGGGYSARLNQELRIRRGLSYGAFSQGESQPSGGMLSAQAQTKPPSAAQALQLMRAEIARLVDEEPPSVDELVARQANLVGSFARRLQTSGGLAALVAGLWTQGRPFSDLARTRDEVLAVTPQQVREFARSHWSAQSQRAVVAGELGTDAQAWPTQSGPAPAPGAALPAPGAALPTPSVVRLTLEQLERELDPQPR